MAKKSTNRRKRKKSKKIIVGRSIALVLFLMLILTVLGYFIAKDLYQKWEARFESNTSVVFIQKDGSVVSNDVIYFDTNIYNQTELGLFIEETISTYNKKHGEGAVVKNSLTIENNVASLILVYKDADTYEDFSGIELFMGSVTEAVAAGYDFGGKFAKIVDGKAVECTKSDFVGSTELKVAIIKANTKIQIEGEILYISAENVMGYGKNWIVTKEGCDLLEVGNQLETETGTDTNTDTEGLTSETENSDISVDGNENLTEEETESGTDIIFDFGDTELPPKEDETYTEVYTYIIYK
ncbi:MAG: hypothetical protein E7283_05540 [Lachnospiraceae bacterium]|nr:hypothetical protein [Lachnospiraceae bacterium]